MVERDHGRRPSREWDDSGYGDQRASALRGTAPPPQARPLLPRPVPSSTLRAPLG